MLSIQSFVLKISRMVEHFCQSFGIHISPFHLLANLIFKTWWKNNQIDFQTDCNALQNLLETS